MKQAAACERPAKRRSARQRSQPSRSSRPLVGQRVVVAARSADEGKLFGSIGVQDIAAAIEKFTGVAVASEHIDLPPPIKEIGLHEVIVRPHPEVEFQL